MKQRSRAAEPLPASTMYAAFYAEVARIPPGKVATYGQIAALAGFPGRARQVGYALAATPEHLELPWHRVINAQGQVSPRAHTGWHGYQQDLLEQEGVEFTAGRTSLKRFGWQPPDDGVQE